MPSLAAADRIAADQFSGCGQSAAASQRVAQSWARPRAQVGMATAVDQGDITSNVWPGSIHPRPKQHIGRRLALEARRIAYGQAGLLSRGPQLLSAHEARPLPSRRRSKLTRLIRPLARLA